MTADIKHETLNFAEALLLMDFGQVVSAQNRSKIDASPVIKMTLCHDGVFRFLPPAPRFKPGGRFSNHSEFIF